MTKRDPLSWVLLTGPLEDGKRRAVRLNGRVETVPERLTTNAEIATHFGVGWVRNWGGPKLTIDGVDAIGREEAQRIRPEATDLETALAGASSRFENLLTIWVDDPLSEAGFVRKGRRWLFGKGDVRPVVEVRERSVMRMTEGMILFTLELGIWIRAHELQVLQAKRSTPGVKNAPYSSTLGWLMDPPRDRWWIVSDKAIYESAYPPIELTSPTAEDEVPKLLREHLAPDMSRADTVIGAIDQIESWESNSPLKIIVGEEAPRAQSLRRLLTEDPSASG